MGGFDDDGNGMLLIERYDIKANQWTILTSIPGAISKTWLQSIGNVDRLLYVSVFHTNKTFVVLQEAHFYNFDTELWIRAPVINDRARYCPTVQLRIDRKYLNKLTRISS